MSGQGDLACCGSWGHKESDTTEWLSWTEPHLAVRLLRPIRERGESTGNHIEERIQLWSRRFRFILTPDCKTNLLLRKMRCRCPLLSWLESIFTDLPLVRIPVPAFPLLKTASPRWHLPEHDSSQLLLFCLWIYADTVPLLKMPFLALFLKHLKVKVKLLSCPTFCDPVDCNRQAPPSMGFSRQEYWSGLPLSFPGDLPDTGIELRSPALQANSLPSEPPGNTYSLLNTAWQL